MLWEWPDLLAHVCHVEKPAFSGVWYHSDSAIDSIFKIKTALVPLQQCRYLPTRNAQWGCVHLTEAPEEFGELRHAKALAVHVQPSLPWPDTVLWWELCERDTPLCLLSWYPSFLHSHYMVYFGAIKMSQNSLADVPYSTNGLFKRLPLFSISLRVQLFESMLNKQLLSETEGSQKLIKPFPV